MERKLPVRTAHVELADEWEGWSFTARTNPTMGTLDDLTCGVFSRVIDGLAATVLEWNFVDEEGQPLPDPKETTPPDSDVKSPELAIRRLPLDLAVAMAGALSDKIVTPEKNS